MTSKTRRPKPHKAAHTQGVRHPGTGGDDSRRSRDPQLLRAMRHAPSLDEDTHWFQILIITFFTAIIMTVVRMAAYEADMRQFFWAQDRSDFIDLFSLVKSRLIFVTAILCVTVMLYHALFRMLYIKRSYAYIPMALYVIFVLASYFLSDLQEFALWGWRDRFEGTVVLVSYMVVLFYTINAVNTERNVKWILWPVGAVASLLGLLGLSQYFRADFFQTRIGGMLITPPRFWDRIDDFKFNFENGQVYQTVFNPNYVSFYLTLLIPLFAMLFFQERRPLRKALLAAVFALLLFNMAGSASSGGFLGLGAAFLIALILLNRRLLQWKGSVLILLAIALAVGAATYPRFYPEVSGAVLGVLNDERNAAAIGTDDKADAEDGNPAARLVIDYFETREDHLVVSIAGNKMSIYPTEAQDGIILKLSDASGAEIPVAVNPDGNYLRIRDPRFDRCSVGVDKQGDQLYLIFLTDEDAWPFVLTEEGLRLQTNVGKLVSLKKVPAMGFEGNLRFGTYRGYIWSRSLPMIADTLLVGNGADTYCAYFPQEDYAGRYSIGWRRHIVVDKPHSFYIATAVNTGVVSLAALIVLFGCYLADSFRLYWRRPYGRFLDYAGTGIFLGVCGFLTAAAVNDSSVSVMPLFYGLLGTGIAINGILKRSSEEL